MPKRALDWLQAVFSHSRSNYREKRSELDSLVGTIQHALDGGDPAAAESRFAEALVLPKLNPELFMVAAAVAEARGDTEAAIRRLERAMELAPADAERQFDLGLRLQELGADDLAFAAFGCAARRKAPFASALSQLGLLQLRYNLLDDALVSLARVVQLLPESAVAHNDLGVAYVALGDLGEALVRFDRSLELEPEAFDVLMNAGRAAATIWDHALARKYYERAVAIRPDKDRARLSLGLARLAAGDLEGGNYILDRVAGDDIYSKHFNRGVAQLALNQFEGAWNEFERARDVAPDRSEACVSLAFLAYNHGQVEKAGQLYETALALNPSDANAQFAHGTVLMMLGDYERGWEKLEKRFDKDIGLGHRLHGFPADAYWDGRNGEGKTLLVWAEQGLGDQMQFVRYAPLIAEKGVEVVLECDQLLARLFAGVRGVSQIVPLGQALPAYDVHCPIGSLPRVMGTRLDTIPAQIPYLHVDPQCASSWRESLSEFKGIRVGLAWAGNPHKDIPVLDRWDQRRSITLAELAPLWQVAGITFISLQKGASREQIEEIRDRCPIVDQTDKLTDFADTAGLVANLDLVISVDTSVVHLAGGMGKPVWVLSRLGGDWRWLLDRADSPWYPSARIFRQQRFGDWSSVIDDVTSQLSAFSSQLPESQRQSAIA